MNLNQAGIDLIKRFEGLRLEAYQDIKGIWTIGYGCTGNIKPGTSISEVTANQMLTGRLSALSSQVRYCLRQALTDNQFSALVCLAYNIGLHALANSTLIQIINAGKVNEAADEFLKWDKADGNVIPGLLERRKAERELFLKN